MINVTKSFLPPRHEYDKILDRAWSSGWLTNRGQLVTELEDKLRDYLGVKNILIVNNGTIAIQIAIKALSLRGEIITTPFSYVATTSSIVWEGCIPVFADIDEKTLNIDPDEIERKITEKTVAILATHVFGVPCDDHRLRSLANKYNLKLIYDAAHTFGSKMNNQSICSFGDIGTLSFHATKLFHTVEGGAIICQDDELFKKMYYMHNFGHNGPENFHGLGINGKISEFNAAMGLAVLPYTSLIIGNRKQRYEAYAYSLDKRLQFQQMPANINYNYAYMPVVFDSESQLLKIRDALCKQGINPRRYFYPSLNKLPYCNSDNMPKSECISERILCLPLYYDLPMADVERICSIVLNNL